jgi:hypothetical protein
MSYFPHGAISAAHAAQEQRKKEQEEEEMTNYMQDDLEKDWEFKIVRASSGAFRNPEIFQALLEEESMAGWELVEKLDDRRVRFKRRRELRRKDDTLPPGLDPYRTQFGRDSQRIAVALGLGVTLFFGAVVLLLFKGESGDGSGGWPIIATLIPMFLVVMLVVMLINRRR